MTTDAATPAALDGITVLDLTAHIAGPYATKLLADLGARVIKVERPGGDPARTFGPWLDDEPGPERSGTHQFLNTNKESIVLDLKSDGGREVLERLLPSVDIAVSSYPPAVAQRLNLTPDDLREVADVNVLSLTNFGWEGPYRDYALSETVLFAMGGEMFSHGAVGREPLKMGGTASLIQCGAMAALGALGAVCTTEVHGITQRVDVSLFDVQLNSVDRRSSAIMAYRFSGRINAKPEVAGPSTGAGVVGVFPCADGYVEMTASAGPYWHRFAEMIDHPEFKDPKWNDPEWMNSDAAREEVDVALYPWLTERTRAEIWEAARNAHAILAPLFTAADLYEDPVFRERGLWTEVEHETLGSFPMLGRPYILSETPWAIRRAAPCLGEHTTAILEETGYDEDTIAELRRTGAVA
ncbi:MAG: CoA transferase [Chloroflexi bacterium]|nr:CoA transferase [Chloroflexota bacterium]